MFNVKCKSCGEYAVSGTCLDDGVPLPEAERHKLSHWVRMRELEGGEKPRFLSHYIKQIVNAIPNYDPSDKPDLLLASLSRVLARPGDWYVQDLEHDYPLACAASSAEYRFYLLSLVRLGFLDQEEGSRRYQISVEGWRRLADLKTAPSFTRIGFVAMRFIAEMHEMYAEAISPAITEAGYRPEISGSPQHNDRIDVRIMAQIKAAQFVVADVSHENQGVYFEAGYAIGLGRPVIWTCNEAAKGKLHFDTRQYAHILWKDAKDLKQQLLDRISATI